MRKFRMITTLVLAIGSISGAFAYTGSLSTGSGLVGTDKWLGGNGTTLSWTVTQNSDATWHYAYELSVPKTATSHFILEVSKNFTDDNIFNENRSFTPGDYTSSSNGNSNPGMPGGIHGLKFVSSGLLAYSLSFDSDRIPVWGDFYARGGQGAAWNAGLTANDTDPSAPAADGSADNHILVPDSVSIVPEPGSLLALGLGAAGLCTVSLRRRVKRGGE